jgi:hypothetical protein
MAINDCTGQKINCGATILELHQPKEKSWRGNLGIAPAKKIVAWQPWNCASQMKSHGAAILGSRQPKKKLRRGNYEIALASCKIAARQLGFAPVGR